MWESSRSDLPANQCANPLDRQGDKDPGHRSSLTQSWGFTDALRGRFRRWSFTALAILTVGIAFLSGAYFKNAGSKSPRLETIPDGALHLGEGSAGQVLTGTFSLGNTGREPLNFSLSPSCACSNLEPRQGVIEPGEFRPIKVGVRLRNEGKDERVAIRLDTNDPNVKTSDFWVLASCPAEILAEPALLDFGVLSREASCQREILLSLPRSKRPPLVSNLTISASTQRLTTHIAVHSSTALRILVRLGPATSDGFFRDVIRLKYADIDREIQLPVTALVRGPVQTAPTILRIPYARKFPVEQEVKLLVWRTDGRPLGETSSLLVPPGLVVSEEKFGTSAQRHLFHVSRSQQESVPSFEGKEIRIRFKNFQEEIRVPIKSN
jgi:hypothetical protein